VAFFLLQRYAAQSDPVIKREVIADFCGLADDKPHTVIDENPASDSGGRVYFNAGQHAPDLGNEAA